MSKMQYDYILYFYLAQQVSGKIVIHNPCIYSAAIILQKTHMVSRLG